MKERMEDVLVYALIFIITAVVYIACLLFWPIRILLDKSSEEEKKDKKLREEAQLNMLKSGRLV